MAGQPSPDRRTSPRVPARLDLTLSRRGGTSIPARTLDVGAGGMRVITPRPLAVDQLLTFHLRLGTSDNPVGGQARVLREYGRSIYALRFEHLGSRTAARLSRFVSGAASSAVAASPQAGVRPSE